MTTKKLTGKVAIVTGASRGIGAAIAKRLAADGAIVAISYNNSPEKANALVKEIQAAGGNAVAHKADAADRKQVVDFVNKVAKELGRLDILVNNAGVLAAVELNNESENLAEQKRQFDINVNAVVAAVHTAVPYLKEGGRIISIGSILGERTPWSDLADYSATKAAVAAYSRGWARDLGPKGITVNTIQPGPINTDMNPDNGDFAETMKKVTALGRYGKPEEIAAAVAFLASDEASYITGITLTVDGGMLA